MPETAKTFHGCSRRFFRILFQMCDQFTAFQFLTATSSAATALTLLK